MLFLDKLFPWFLSAEQRIALEHEALVRRRHRLVKRREDMQFKIKYLGARINALRVFSETGGGQGTIVLKELQ